MFWIIPLAGILNFLLGLIVWLRKPKDPLHYGFFIFVLSTVASIALDFTFRFYPTIFVLQSAYAVAAFIPLTLLMWVLELCNIPLRQFSFWKKLLVFTPTGIAFILCYTGGLVVEEIYELTVLGYHGKLGPLFIVYSLYYLVYIAIMFFLLYRKNKGSNSTEKIQIRFITTGILLYSISAMIFSLILPTYFQIFDFTLLDAPSLIFFVGLTAYTILRLKLFNIKVIATELLMFLLFIFTLVQLIIAKDTQDKIINAILLFVTLVVGASLIRSVIKEVDQREKIETLAKDLEKSNGDLEKANDRLREIDQLKSEFVSLATHQIRGPLTSIKGFASLILEGDYGEVSPTLKDPIDKMYQSSQALVGIVQDFLDVSRIEQGKMVYDFTVFDLVGLVHEVVGELTPVVEKKGLQLSFETNEKECTVKADRGKIRQVISNLIDNAMKYTEKGSIAVSLANKADKYLISVKDTGIGLAEETIGKLFQKFSRAKDAHLTNASGSGLGLYVAKEMVLANHGRVWAESLGVGKGSTFILELDRHRETPAEKAAPVTNDNHAIVYDFAKELTI